MKKNISRLLHITALCVGFSIGPITAFGAGQFSATLDNPVRVVSDYFTEKLSFSAAIGSRTYAQAMPGLVNTPRLLSADFETHSLEFNTDYFRTQSLVPVSVDADAYLNYRVKSLVGRRLGENVMRNIVEAQRSQRRQGLSVGINLPKRFDNVFGEGGANLKVSGFRRISFSGRSQWTGGADSGPFRQSKFPSLNMEQISRFDITGTIGTKISVSVSQDSQTDIPLSNRLQLRYKGDDDDILQTIEAGNTNLNLSNTRFVGYSSRIQGLFGIKAEAQLGNLHLTAIASQEKGSSERATISATGEQSVNYIRDYQYAQGRIFDLPGERSDGTWGKNDSVLQLYVFEHDIRDSLETDSAIIFVDSVLESSVTLRKVKVKQLRGNEDYWWVDDPQRNLHYVVFRSQRREGLAVNIEIARYDDDFNFLGTDIVGAQPDTGAFQLRFIRALSQDFKVNHPTWKLMWRNAYAIPRGTTVEDLKLKIFKGLQNREGTPGQQDFQNNSTTNSHYISILGLDQLNDGSGARIPDNRLDDARDVFRPDWGLVIFPEREPFNSTRTFTDSLGNTTSPLAVRLDNIYNFVSASEQTERSEYYLQISTAGARSNTIRLNRANILEGSERVTVNGRLLTRGVDYNIQYDFGQVTLLSEDATDPNAELNIDFEYAPFLAVQKKSLLGMRAEYEWSRDFSFGTTILFKSDKAQDRKPRVGQETSKALVADIDMSLRLRPNFITRMVNALPLVSTEVPSSMQITAEVAQSRPNPNVEGEAFIDDFESAIENVTLGLTRSSWKLASKPFGLDNSYERGRMLWHQIGRIPWEDVFNSESPVGQNGIIPLRIVFRPNNNIRFRDVGGQAERIVPATPPANNWWAGITRAFGNRLDAKRLQLFEMRVRAFGRGGVLHLDFGRISEDTDGDGEPDTEDTDLNRSITEEEDVGLDHLADFEEPGFDADTLQDPSGDNWYHQGEGHCPLPASLCNNPAFVDQLNFPAHPLFAEWLNGTDGNRQDVEFFQQPDEEKFSTAGHSLTDAYFSFKVDLANDTIFEVEGSRLIDDDPLTPDWVTYRIPIRDTNLFIDPNVAENVSLDEPADWANVTHVRVWYEAQAGETMSDVIEIATWGFVQSNWQDSLVSPTFGNGTFFVASVTEEENAIFNSSNIPYEPYVSPIDNVTEPRRALSLIYENLKPDDTGFVTKDLVSTESYTGYRKLEMYVYAPQSAAGDSLAFFFRLGLNEENFYEFSTQLQPLWHEGNWVNIDFNDITALKDSALRALARPNDPLDIVSGKYRIKGRPNLNEIKFFAAGVANTGSNVVSGEIWMDELRLTDVRDDPGTAARINVSGSLADLATYGFSIEHKDPFFRGLSSVTRGGGNNNLGSGRTDDRFSFNTTVNIDKFLPRTWKARVPISFTYNKSTLVPLVRTNSDIVLPESVRQAEKTTSVSRTFRISESFSKAGKNPLFTVLLNRQRMSMSYSRSERSSPTNPFSLSENYNVRSNYDMGIRSMPRIPIFFWTKSIPFLKKTSESRLGLFPDTWRWSATFNRSLSITDDTQLKRVTSRRRDFDGRMNLTYRMFDNLTTSITYNTRRDLTDPDLVNLSPSNFRLGLETNYGQSLRADYAPPLLSFLTTSFNYSATYNDVLDRSSETRRSDLARTMGVSGRFDHIALLGGASRGAGRRGAVRSTGSGRSLRRTAEKRTPFYLKPVAGLRFLTKWINPLTYRYSETFNSSLPGMQLRPSLGYRIGLTRDTDVPIGSGDTRNPSSREGKSYEFSSGFTLFGGLTTDARYRQQDSQDLVRIGTRSKRSSTNWPDLTIRIRRLTYFPLIKNYINKFIDIFGPRTGYSRSVREDFNLDGGFATNRTESIDRNPLLAINFRLLRSLSLSGAFSTSQSNVERFNQTNGSKLTESRSNRKTIQASTKYSFSAPGGIALPIFGRLKFASTVSIDLTVRFNTNKTETARSGNKFIPTRDQTDLSVTPIISYTFSRQIRGGISGLWQDTNDRLNRVSHIRQLQIWTEIRF